MRGKKLVIDFLKDSMDFVLAYFLNIMFLLLFFYLYYEKVEVIYPLALSLFIFTIFILIKWFKYKAFNKDIDMSVNNVGYKLTCSNNEQRRAAGVIERIHLNYNKEISKLRLEGREQRRLISQFIHSLKAPITVIDIAASNMLDKAGEEEELRNSALQDIRNEKSKILNTVDNLLSLLRLDEFSMDYSAAAVNLEEELRNIINGLKTNFIYGKVVPKVYCNTETPIIYTDEKWNNMMLEQFISNGIKYSMPADGMKTLIFNITREDENIILSIKDEGIGIPDYDMDRITEPFFTGENGRNVKNSSGIGLYIARKISEKLNHKIKIISKLNQGTEAKITYLSKL
jgi:signal transduction histidine kinase